MTHKPSQSDQLNDLFAAFFDGRLGDAERSALERRLLTDDAAADAYLRYADHNAELSVRCGPARPIAQPCLALERDRASIDQSRTGDAAANIPIYRKGYEPEPSRFRPHHFALAIAAALLVAGIAVAIVSVVAEHNRQGEIERRQAELAARRAAEPVATLIESTGGNLTTPVDYPSEGRDYPRGEYTLTSGTAEFMLTNAVNVKLRGDTRMYMRNDMNVSLARGSAAFVCPTDAKGFTVHLPDKSRIVDLGTAFRVVIDDAGQAKLLVTEGRVRFVLPNGASRIIQAGYAAKVADDDTLTLESATGEDALAHRWTFNLGDGRDDIGAAHGELLSGASIDADRLVLDGQDDLLRADTVDEAMSVKTFVAWVSPADLDQGGGGVVTIEQGDAYEVFDAIVFAEQAPRLWMAGSEGFQRTQPRPQVGEPESADADETVMIAIAYDADGTIRLYRNGRLYASYETSGPVVFDKARVLMGLRHTHANPVGAYFGGSIDEVRIYRRALSHEEIEMIHWQGPVTEDPNPSHSNETNPSEPLTGDAP